MAELLTPVEVAAELGMAPRTLANKRSNPDRHGAGPRFVKVGRLVRYRRADLESWLAANAHDRTPMPDRGRRRAS